MTDVSGMRAPVSQEIWSLGNCVAATKLPRKNRRSNYAMRPYFLGNIAAARKYCRACAVSMLKRLNVGISFHFRRGRQEESGRLCFEREAMFICIVYVGNLMMAAACMKLSSRLVKSIENSKSPWYCTASCQEKLNR